MLRASFCDGGVEVIVKADQGSDANFISRNILTGITKALPARQIKTLSGQVVWIEDLYLKICDTCMGAPATPSNRKPAMCRCRSSWFLGSDLPDTLPARYLFFTYCTLLGKTGSVTPVTCNLCDICLFTVTTRISRALVG